jgi:CheY-like chemotaxis protein
VLAKIFEPFFTTKPSGIGTGLGLATSASIIDNHDARISVASAVGEGTTFTIVFAAARFSEAETLTASRDVREFPPRGNGECVLIVDDELAIRTTTKRTLEKHGYRAVLAANGLEALRIVGAKGLGVELVFTDMAMPFMGGMETAESLSAHYPHIPVIATSGYTMSADVGLAKTAGITEFVPKPYTTAELLWAVHRALLPDSREQ